MVMRWRKKMTGSTVASPASSGRRERAGRFRPSSNARVGDTDAQQGLQPYFINDSLHTMMRDSPKNGGKVMKSAQDVVVVEEQWPQQHC